MDEINNQQSEQPQSQGFNPIIWWETFINNLKHRKPTSWILLFLIIGLVVTAIYGVIENKASQLFDSVTNESDKYIAVIITNKSDESFSIPQEFRIGFGNDADFKFETNGQTITSQKDDDALSTKQAELLADKYLNDENCVLIIGNSTSTLTDVTLSKILSFDKEKPSFLLPIATADNITDKAKDQKYNGILRMMPNNEKQAITIKNFIFHKFPNNPKVLIYVDEDNLTYSQNLSQKISDKILKSKGTVILKKNYGNSNRLIDDIENLKKQSLKPDILIFVGISTNGSLLMEEMKNQNYNLPTIFTDGCTVKSLMDKSKNNPNQYYISAVQKSSGADFSPTYEPVGQDARELAKSIIKNLDGDIDRSSVNKYIEKIRKENTLILDDGKAGKYSFNENGENTSMFWKVYRYINGELTMEYEDN